MRNVCHSLSQERHQDAMVDAGVDRREYILDLTPVPTEGIEGSDRRGLDLRIHATVELEKFCDVRDEVGLV